MAELILKDIVKKRGIENKFYIESAATSFEEVGNPVYPPAVRKLAEYGISAKGKRALRIEKGDYERFDHIIGMEDSNISSILRIIGEDRDNKVCKLLDFAGGGNISDPWYTYDFQSTYDDILLGCNKLLEYLVQKGDI